MPHPEPERCTNAPPDISPLAGPQRPAKIAVPAVAVRSYGLWEVIVRYPGGTAA
jgi:hypothetical protein